MSEAPKPCPECRSPLQLGHKSGLTTWECTEAHGVGIFLTEAYGHLQRDELEAIWEGAKRAPLSKLRSPLNGELMAEVTFTVDSDTQYGNDGMGSTQMVIEVDTSNYFGWFSFAELRAMPVDDTGRGPNAPGLVGLDQMGFNSSSQDQFFDSLTAADYEDGDEYEGSGLSRVFGGLARRLRG